MRCRTGSLALTLAFVLLGGAACSGGEKPRPADALAPEALARPAEGRSAPHAAPAVAADAPLVAFLGDSITAGLHLEPSEAFPAVVQRELAGSGRPFRLVNAGVSGDTSAGGLRRLDWILRQEPDVLVLELGGNDGLRGQPVAEVEARLGDIVARAQAAGARVLLLAMRLPSSLGADYVSEFEALYERLAEAHECPLVPFLDGVGGVAGMMLADGVHPSRAGHARLAANVGPALGELLDELSAAR